MKTLTLLATLFTSFACFAYPKTPRIWDSPGRLCTTKDKDFERFRYPEKVAYCKRNVSVRTKDRVCASYGVYDRAGYTVDHIIPLSLGGSNHVSNLWCQSRKIYTGHLEFYFYRMVSQGKMRHATALHAIMSWKFNPKNKDHVPRPPDGIEYPFTND